MIVQRFGSTYPEQEDHTNCDFIEDPVLPLERNLHVMHWLVSYGRRSFENILLEEGKDGVFFFDREMQLFLSVYVDEMKMARAIQKTCRRCGQYCKRKSIWKTQYHSLIRCFLDVLSEQHK